MGGMAHMDEGTGVIFGFLKEILFLQEFFDTDNFLFCWDSRKSIRRKMMPEYKSLRRKNKRLEKEGHESNEDENKKPYWEEVKRQSMELRKNILPTIGFNNSFIQNGYEADDLMALCAKKMRGSRFGFIVTADHDLYQCISKNVSCYNPSSREKNKTLSLSGFRKQNGIEPIQWAKVKAIAGCTSDSIPGIRGVGETTVIQHIRDELNPNSKKSIAIHSDEGLAIAERNMPIVKLPLEGVAPIQFVSNDLSDAGWENVSKEFGLRSIQEHSPGRRRQRKKVKKQNSLFD